MAEETMQSQEALQKNVFAGSFINWNYNDVLKSIGTLNILLFLLMINSWIFSQYFNVGWLDKFFVGFVYVLGFINMVVAFCVTIYAGLRISSLDKHDRIFFMFAFLVTAIYCRVFALFFL